MSNKFRENIKTLLEYSVMGNEITEYIKELPENKEKIKKIEGQISFEHNGQYYLLHSRNEKREADRILKNVEKSKDYLLVLYGIGNLTLIRKLIKYTSEHTKILLIEENPYVFQYYMYKENLTDILKSEKILFALGESKIYKLAVQVCIQAEWSSMAYNLKVIQLPNYHVYHKQCKEKIKYLSDEITAGIIALGNDLTDMMNGVENNYLNVDQCIISNSISEIRGKYEGIPGIVVASGPSLDKNIQYLKEAYGKAVIIACDASYQMCIEHGVKPDAIASIERGIETYHYFYKGKEIDKDTVFVGPALVWPDILEEFPGKKILLSKTLEGADGWWRKQFEKIEHLPTGFSCANVAHAVLQEAGCNPIILIGQDLAYTDGKKHSEEAHKAFGDTNKISENNRNIIWTEGIDGEMVKTTETFNLFRKYFERQALRKEKLLIDATEGGAKIHGSKIMTFKEAIDKYCIKQKQCNINEHLEKIPWNEKKAKEKYKQIIESAKEVIKIVEELEEMMKKHVKKIAKYQTMDFEKSTQEELIQCVVDMQGGNELINYVTEKNKEIATFYGPVYKNAIMYVKRIGNNLDAKSVRENHKVQVRLIFMMQIISKTVKEKFQELILFMEEKQEKDKKGKDKKA